ncbi:MAG: hypothetical protein ACI835_003856 [Planctomycetota bacterium]|jgi:hypothetical protein
MHLTSLFKFASASAIAILSIIPSAHSEVRPNDECVDCHLIGQHAGANNGPQVPISVVCNLTKSYQAGFGGTPSSGMTAELPCVNCPTMNGEPCEPGSGPELQCDLSFSKQYEITVSIDYSVSNGIDVGFFESSFELGIGLSSTTTRTVTVAGSYRTPHCKKASIAGTYSQLKGKKGTASAVYTRTDTYRDPNDASNLYDYNYSCKSGTATITYDGIAVAGGLSVRSLDDCSYDGGSGSDH